ncbi:MAG: PhnD/SsuA/transferrin family substrate-binding protein [Myxococcales bacterium]|jgi:hypothetical protein|nr:PhnD/SsuA/transferrin family substrate-binding protein [Myxococcales bacterium]
MNADNGLFAVCPHDTARGIDKWAMFNTRVNKRLGLGSRFHAYLDFAEFGRDLLGGRFAWAYLNPADFVKAKKKLGYAPVVRPVARFDVARIVAREGMGEVRAGARVAAVPGYLKAVVEHTLREEGTALAAVDAKSYGEVVTMVRDGRAEFGITYNEHFDVLSATSRQGIVAIRSFDFGLSHVLAVRPDLGVSGIELGRWLLSDPEGQKAGDVIGVSGWETVDESPFESLATILGV